MSDIGRSIAHTYGKAGWSLVLAARHPSRLDQDAADLHLRYGVAVVTVAFDVTDTRSHKTFMDHMVGLPETVICVVGLLGMQADAARNWPDAERILLTNYVGPVSILGEVANRMEARGHGCLIGISSVAGDRGRASNYLYGSAKAGLSAFLSGLRNRLDGVGVRVITVKPGFVETAMTRGMPLPKLLTAQPEEVAQAIFSAQLRGRDVIYVRAVWRVIMLIIRLIPEGIFKRLPL